MRSVGSVRFGPFRLDLANECLWRGGDSIGLTPKAFAVLAHLANHPDQLVTKNDLLDSVWPNTFVSEAVLKVIISELRKVLGDDAKEPRFIATAHRRGYRFIATVESDSSAPPTTVAPAASSLHLVGRDEEMKHLNETYSRACAGERQMVFIAGEGGIGLLRFVHLPTRAAPGCSGSRTDDFRCAQGSVQTETLPNFLVASLRLACLLATTPR